MLFLIFIYNFRSGTAESNMREAQTNFLPPLEFLGGGGVVKFEL